MTSTLESNQMPSGYLSVLKRATVSLITRGKKGTTKIRHLWPRASRTPQGHFARNLVHIGDKDTANQILLIEHDIPHSSFSQAVLDCLPPEGKAWSIPEDELKLRNDLRDYNICSVDPPGCTDIDDALHYRDIDEDICEVGVHIADVSYFVKGGTPLDQEAANRGTTVYLSDKRIDMIPELLSSNLCSLIQHQDRLAFSAIWTMRKKSAEVIDVKFTRSVINSKASLTYEQAQNMIDDKKNNGPLHHSLRCLNELAKKLKKRRMDRGALVLARADEIRFIETESETYDDTTKNFEIQHKCLVDTNSMIEEFMLLANIAVANKLLEAFPKQALLRRHPKPSKLAFDELVQSARNKGFNITADDGKSLSASLDQAKLPGNEFFNLMLRMIATRCMTPAAYFCSGFFDSNQVSFTHFGLAADLYTHFTSPIRRYADLLVHRLLAVAIGRGEIDRNLKDKNNVQLLCDHINYRHRMAQLASRASARLHTVLYIKSKRELFEEAYVFSVRHNAIQILIPKIAFEYTYTPQPSENWKFDVDEKTQTNVISNIKLKQFDKLKVHISISKKEESKFSNKILVRIIEPPIDKIDNDESFTSEAGDSAIQEIDAEMSIPEDEFLHEEREKLKQLAMDKRKIRSNYSEIDSNSKPIVVMPGEVLSFIPKEATMLGPGLMRDDEKVVATRCGILKMRSNNLVWIDSYQKRYVAVRGECVIGVVRSKSSLHARIDINSADSATLSLLAFEGANKRNKPNLNVGDLVYAKVLSASKHVETELVCVNSNGKRDGLGVIGDTGGVLIPLSIDTVRVLLSPQCDLLEQLGQAYRYEIALGMNGRVWINSNETSTIISVANELRRFGLA